MEKGASVPKMTRETAQEKEASQEGKAGVRTGRLLGGSSRTVIEAHTKQTPTACQVPFLESGSLLFSPTAAPRCRRSLHASAVGGGSGAGGEVKLWTESPTARI